jgi:hypothetical protein
LVFPRSYAKRWKARQHFDLRRAALAHAAAQFNSAGTLRRNVARIAENLQALLLLITLRPWDALTNIRQRIDFYRGRT